MIFSGIILLVIYRINYKQMPSIKKPDWGLIMQGSIFGVFLTYAPEFWALQYLSAAKIAFLFVLAPFFSFIFEFFQNKKSVTFKKFLGMLIAFCGVIPILLPSEVYQHTVEAPISFFFLELIVVFSVACYAFGWFSVKKLIQEKEYSSLIVNGFNKIIGGFLCLIVSLFYECLNAPSPVLINWAPYCFYILLISMVGIFCFSLYTMLLKHYSATFVSSSGFIEPFFAAFYGWIFLSESVSWVFFCSTLIVGVGLYIFYLEELRINPQR